MRLALITHASEFCGPAAVRGLLAAGFEVLASDPRFAQGDCLVRFMARFPSVRTRSSTDATALLEDARATGLPLHVVVSNDVHPAHQRATGEATAGDLREALEALVVAPFQLLTAAAGVFRAQGQGRAIVITSSRDRLPQPGGAIADAARAATNALVRGFAVDLAPFGVAVNAIAPNFFASEAYFPKARYVDDPIGHAFVSEQVPAGRLGDEAELAALVTYLATTPGNFHTGSVIEFAGGWPAGRPRPW